MKFRLTCLVILMTYCKYVQQFQICNAPFMGRNLDWNKTTIINNHLCFLPNINF